VLLLLKRERGKKSNGQFYVCFCAFAIRISACSVFTFFLQLCTQKGETHFQKDI
jgi:hypothetical protein